MGTLIPGQALIYEKANGVTYAKYRDPPHNAKPRWIIGGRADMHEDFYFPPPNTELSSVRWKDIEETAKKNPALQKQLDTLLTIYYTVKDEYKKEDK